MIVRCKHRHPSSNFDNFITQLENLISSLNQSNHQVFIVGDMSIDFLKVGTHSKTKDYLDMLYSSNLLPVITKPTRITSHTATLIDHIYTNASTDQTISGIVTMDISNHLPTFCLIRRQIARLKPKRFFRDYSNFNSEAYLNDIKLADWSSILSDLTDLHTKANIFVEKLKDIANKHARIKHMPRSRLKQKFPKPWIIDIKTLSHTLSLLRLDKVAY